MNDYPSGYALFLLRQAVELFEMDQQCNDPGTMEWVWLQQARDILGEPETESFPPSHGTPDLIVEDLADFCRAGFGEIKASSGLYGCNIDTLTLPSEIYHRSLDKMTRNLDKTLQVDVDSFSTDLETDVGLDFDIFTGMTWHTPRWQTTHWDIESSNWPHDMSFNVVIPTSEGEDTFESYTVEMAVEPAYESPDEILFAPVKAT